MLCGISLDQALYPTTGNVPGSQHTYERLTMATQCRQKTIYAQMLEGAEFSVVASLEEVECCEGGRRQCINNYTF